MVQRHEAAFELFITHQQLSEPVEPAMRDFHNPASWPLWRMPSASPCLLGTALDMRNIALPFHDRLRGLPAVAIVGAQMFAALDRRRHMRKRAAIPS